MIVRNREPEKGSGHTMGSSKTWLCRCIAVLLALMLVLPGEHAMAQEAVQTKAAQPTQMEDALPENPSPANSQAAESVQQGAAAPQTGTSQQQNGTHKPVGTAAAPYERTMGIAASRPAGAAIAPAKQRRVRTILISVGVIAGAGIAIGSVAALSHGSPSHP